MSSALKKLHQWGLPVFPGTPFLIAGPCSAENRNQLLTTAEAISHLPVSLFRAGVWKTRTLPETYSGAGNVALSWLQEVKKKTGLKVAIEIDHPSHLEEALKADIDAFWLGARTTVNPFAVEELAIALSGVDKPLFVKNPIIPDLSVWVDAIERLQKHGIEKIGVVLRGFVNRQPSKWRYEPEWDLVAKFRQIYPNLPYLCDPSHIAGHAEMILGICQKAMDLNYHGLMIETHINPAKALSDVKQQLKPKELEDLLDRLLLKNPEFAADNKDKQLSILLQKIDKLDLKLLEDVVSRIELNRQINKLSDKKLNLSDLAKPAREFAKKHALSEKFIEEIFSCLIREAEKEQE